MGPGNKIYLYGTVFQGIYTNQQAGQDAFKGWLKEGTDKFKDLTETTKNARATDACKALEANFLATLKAKLGLMAASAEEERKAKRRRTVICNEVEESDGEEDFEFD